MSLTRWITIICVGWVVLIFLAFMYGCATPPEKVDALTAAIQRNSKLCDPHGGMKRIDFGSEYADVWCRNDNKGFRIWYYK